MASGIPIADGFLLGSQKPVDLRSQVNTYVELEAIPTIQRYLGLKTYVIEEKKYYYLKEDINIWEEYSSGSEGVTKEYIVGIGGVQAYQIVFITSANTIMPSDCNNETIANRIVGIALETGLEGSNVKVKKIGGVINPSWIGSFVTSDIVYVGNGGLITKNPINTVGFIQKIGFFDNDLGSLVLDFGDCVLL